MKSLLILNYHKIVIETSKDEWSAFDLPFSQFRYQLKLIEKSKTPVIALKDWLSGNLSNGFYIALTFDDGCSSVTDYALPELKKRRFPFSVFPVVEKVESSGSLKWNELKSMMSANVEIGSHGMTHKPLYSLLQDELNYEVRDSKEIIDEQLNIKTTYFALPFGVYGRRSLKTLRNSGYYTVFSTRSKLNYDPNLFIQHRLNVKSTMSLSEFESLLKGKKTYLLKRSVLSFFALELNRISGVLKRLKR